MAAGKMVQSPRNPVIPCVCVHSVASRHLSSAACEQVLQSSFMGGDVEAWSHGW